MKEGTADDKRRLGREHRLGGSVAVMGISNIHSGAAFALSGSDHVSAASAVMQWDLVNPWSRVYELHYSTH